MSTILRLIHEADITPALDAAMIELITLANPGVTDYFKQHGRGWQGVKPAYCTIVELDSRPIAYVGIIDRIIRVGPSAQNSEPGTQNLRVAGVQNVSVHPDYRGQKLSIGALVMAMNHALMQGFDVGLLFCHPDLERLYSKTGWAKIPNSPIIRTENNRDLPIPDYNITMFLPLKQKSFPPGPVHLQGNDW